MSSGLVVSSDDESEVESLAHGTRDVGCGGRDGHGCTLLHGVDGDLALHVADHELGIADDSGDGHPDVV